MPDLDYRLEDNVAKIDFQILNEFIEQMKIKQEELENRIYQLENP